MDKRVQEHNREVIRSAEFRAEEMRTWPSPLEERMMEFFDENFVDYVCQKIFYIYKDDGWISRYYIADFYIPSSNTIVEVDGKFHDEHRQHDKERTRIIQENYPGIEVLRYRWKDLRDSSTMEELLDKVSL